MFTNFASFVAIFLILISSSIFVFANEVFPNSKSSNFLLISFKSAGSSLHLFRGFNLRHGRDKPVGQLPEGMCLLVGQLLGQKQQFRSIGPMLL
jgi:hypothetical protein